MSGIQFIFPRDICFPSLPDSAYLEEYEAAREAGIPCSLVNIDVVTDGVANPALRIRPALIDGVPVIYRGWMLKVEQYQVLENHVLSQGSSMLSSWRDYAKCHHMPNWYDACREFTPATLFFKEDQADQIPGCLREHGWSACFVKDYVKSLTTSAGSIAHNLQDVDRIIAEIRKYRDGIEGGICLREVEDFIPESELRCFVVNGSPFMSIKHADVGLSTMISHICSLIDSPFFTVDCVKNSRNEWRLVEIGDGQVSDRKEWNAARFIGIFADFEHGI